MLRPALILTLAAACWAGPPADPAAAGREAYRQGEFKEAAERFEKAIEAAPNSSELYHWLGKSYGRVAENASFITAARWAGRCRDAFEKAVRLDPRNLEAWSDLLEYYLEAPGFLGGGVDKAEHAAEAIARLSIAEGHKARAKLAEDREDYAEAEQEYRRARQAEPDQAGRAVDLAVFLAKRGQANEAEAAFRQAEGIDPDHLGLLFQRAKFYVQEGRDLASARLMLERYLRAATGPDDPPREEAQKLLRQASRG